MLSARIVPAQQVKGTLVIAVPVTEGLVVCSDKRLFNVDAGTFTDTNVKIRKAGENALFVATNTIGLYDSRTRRMAFDVNEITAAFAAGHEFKNDRRYWQALKTEIDAGLRKYFREHSYAEWPETDKANNKLLFNLFFYSVSGQNAWSHTIKVLYEKAKTPQVYISAPVTEQIRKPKLSGKGRDVLTYLSRNPSAGNDPAIFKFDESIFDVRRNTIGDAVVFAEKLFAMTNKFVPSARVSSAFDCALLSYQKEFRWLNSTDASR